MAVVDTKSTYVTNADATPVELNPSYQNGTLREQVATIEATSGDSIGSTYRMLRVFSGWRISDLIIDSDDIGTTAAADVGLYDVASVNAGAVVDADFFASALSLSGGALAATNITHESAVIDVANKGKRIWEQLALTTDPGKWYDIVLTLTAATDAAGTITLRARYVEN